MDLKIVSQVINYFLLFCYYIFMEMIVKENLVSLLDEKIVAATMEFEIKNDLFYINRTYTNPNYRGKGLPQQLLDKLIDMAVQKGLKIVPICSYVVNKFEQDKYRFIDGRLD